MEQAAALVHRPVTPSGLLELRGAHDRVDLVVA